MLIGIDNHGVTLALWNADRRNFGLEKTVLLGLCSLVLAGQREGILVGAADLELVGHVFSRFGHGVDPVLGLERLVDEAPAYGRIENGCIAGKSGIGLA